eukprot:scaffold4777_cov258-Pinguiococcus_pyrenoidosus.AAC.3
MESLPEEVQSEAERLALAYASKGRLGELADQVNVHVLQLAGEQRPDLLVDVVELLCGEPRHDAHEDREDAPLLRWLLRRLPQRVKHRAGKLPLRRKEEEHVRGPLHQLDVRICHLQLLQDFRVAQDELGDALRRQEFRDPIAAQERPGKRASAEVHVVRLVRLVVADHGDHVVDVRDTLDAVVEQRADDQALGHPHLELLNDLLGVEVGTHVVDENLQLVHDRLDCVVAAGTDALELVIADADQPIQDHLVEGLEVRLEERLRVERPQVGDGADVVVHLREAAYGAARTVAPKPNAAGDELETPQAAHVVHHAHQHSHAGVLAERKIVLRLVHVLRDGVNVPLGVAIVEVRAVLVNATQAMELLEDLGHHRPLRVPDVVDDHVHEIAQEIHDDRKHRGIFILGRHTGLNEVGQIHDPEPRPALLLPAAPCIVRDSQLLLEARNLFLADGPDASDRALPPAGVLPGGMRPHRRKLGTVPWHGVIPLGAPVFVVDGHGAVGGLNHLLEATVSVANAGGGRTGRRADGERGRRGRGARQTLFIQLEVEATPTGFTSAALQEQPCRHASTQDALVHLFEVPVLRRLVPKDDAHVADRHIALCLAPFHAEVLAAVRALGEIALDPFVALWHILPAVEHEDIHDWLSRARALGDPEIRLHGAVAVLVDVRPPLKDEKADASGTSAWPSKSLLRAEVGPAPRPRRKLSLFRLLRGRGGANAPAAAVVTRWNPPGASTSL